MADYSIIKSKDTLKVKSNIKQNILVYGILVPAAFVIGIGCFYVMANLGDWLSPLLFK